jgi:hypothetical protein
VSHVTEKSHTPVPFVIPSLIFATYDPPIASIFVTVYNTFSIPETASLAVQVTAKEPLTAAPFIGVVIATVGFDLSTIK